MVASPVLTVESPGIDERQDLSLGVEWRDDPKIIIVEAIQKESLGAANESAPNDVVPVSPAYV